MYKRGGWEGRGVEWVVGEDGQPQAGYTFHKDTDSSAVHSLRYKNEYNL